MVFDKDEIKFKVTQRGKGILLNNSELRLNRIDQYDHDSSRDEAILAGSKINRSRSVFDKGT